MPEYLNGKIYTIRSYKSDLIFYGATTTTLARCLASYKDKYRKHTSAPLQKPQVVFELIQFDDVYIELVEAFPCTCSDALKKRVLELVREHPDSLNTKQIKKNIKVEIKEVRQQVINHGEQRDVHHKCLCGGQYRIHQRARHYKTKIHTDYVANTN